jgi:hypothetical protein
MDRKKVSANLRVNGYGPEKGARRIPIFTVNEYAPEFLA